MNSDDRHRLHRLEDFAKWIASLDDDDPRSAGRVERQTITLTKICREARAALGEKA